MSKRGALLAVVLFAFILVLGSSIANATFSPTVFEQGCVIPYALYNGSGIDTAVGILASGNGGNGGIYWSFYDENGVPLMSGSIPTTATQYEYSFSLANKLAGAHSGVVGWLLITWDNDGVLSVTDAGGGTMAASAFLINLTNKDAAFLPVVPLNIADYNLAAPITLLNPPNSPLLSMTHGQSTAAVLASRFLVSASDDPRTTLIVFTPLDAPVQWTGQAASSTGALQALSPINTMNHHLNVFDVKTIAPPGFTDGYLIINNVATSPFGIMFSLTLWSVVGAEQTIIAVGG